MNADTGERCACGGRIVVDTDGILGRTMERCTRCGRTWRTPRALPDAHPVMAEIEGERRALRAAVQRARARLPMCAMPGCPHHVAHSRAIYCAECAVIWRPTMAMRQAAGYRRDAKGRWIRPSASGDGHA